MNRILLLFILLPAIAFGQTVLSGKVVAASEPNGLPGVNIVIKRTLTGTMTDIDGNFDISVPNAESVLVLSLVGYNKLEVTVGSQSALKIITFRPK